MPEHIEVDNLVIDRGHPAFEALKKHLKKMRIIKAWTYLSTSVWLEIDDESGRYYLEHNVQVFLHKDTRPWRVWGLPVEEIT